MTPKKADYDACCTVPLNNSPAVWQKLVDTYFFFYRTVIYPLLNEDLFAPMYSDVDSRPGTSASLTMSLMTIMAEKRLSQEEAVEELHFDQRFQLATNTLGMDPADIPGSYRMFSRFEARAQEYAKDHGGLNLIDLTYENIAAACCALTGMDLSLLRSDSLQVSGNFTVRSREELVYLAVSKGVEYLMAHGTEEQKEAIQNDPSLNKYNEVLFTLNAFDYHWSASVEDKRKMLCKDATALLPLFSENDKEAEWVSRCIQAIDEQTRLEDGRRVFIPKGDEALKTGSLLQSLDDPDATCRKKNNKYYWGYVANAMESVNGLTHLPIFSCLYPNKTEDAAMDGEFFEKLPEFSKKLDGFYSQYPVLVKGNPFACQEIVQGVLGSLRKDFLDEGNTLYQMIQDGCPSDAIKEQQKKLLSVLDTFYPRLAAWHPLPPKKESGPEGEEAPSKSRKGETDHAESEGTGSAGKETDHVSVDAAQQKPTFDRTMTDWANYGEDPISWDSPEFAQMTAASRRNFYLRKVAEKSEDQFALPHDVKICISDGAYSSASEKASEAGYILLTTNALGRKANPIIALFEKEGDTYKRCPKGHPVEKQHVETNGSVHVWVESCYCSTCPCAADCKATALKRFLLHKMLLDVHAIPALIDEAKVATDDYQELGDIRNGTECLMSYFRNYYHCDKWPIGMIIKQRICQLVTSTACIKNLWLFSQGRTRVHPNKLLGTKKD